jgi:hypothetical protein
MVKQALMLTFTKQGVKNLSCSNNFSREFNFPAPPTVDLPSPLTDSHESVHSDKNQSRQYH